MPLSPGTRLGPYEIVAAVGAGGMGEVYRARDRKLDRDVAIKILAEAVAADPDRIARFEREAKTLAALNHPNIAHIHGFEEADGLSALVMELVEGPTLADRIAKRPIPVDEALPIAKQIAEALEAAHEQGIIHRDLKPANVKVRDDGTVKVLDFGLAKALEPTTVIGAEVTESPTITSPAMMTRVGMILGTAAYMSPEQAKGRPADKRSDVWAFGCVLYEMLTGRRAFPGDEVSDVLASILAREPNLSALPAPTPLSIRRLLRRCLQKVRNERLRDIGDARIEIQDALTQRDAEDTAITTPHADNRGWQWAALVSILAFVLLIATVRGLRPAAPTPEMHLEINTPSTNVPASLAISPDGRAIAFVGIAEKQSRLWLRTFDSAKSRPLVGTDGAEDPFWSPDSRSVGFFADNKLKRVDLDGGSVRILARVSRGTGGAWSRDGVILISRLGVPISRVPDTGGEPVDVSGLFKQGSDFSPQFLPDGQHFLYRVRGTREADGVYVGQLDGKLEARRLLESATGAVYAPSGHVLFVRQRTLFAQRFDPVGLRVMGNPFRLVEDSTDCACLGLSVSDTGSIAYRTTAQGAERTFVWFDRSGNELGKVGDSSMSSPLLSPDGQRVVGYRGNPVDGNVDIWMLDVTRGVFSRLTDDVADDTSPVWSPDGDHIVFSSNRKGTPDLYQKSAFAGGSEELLWASAQPKVPDDWSSDGRFVLFESRDRKTGADIWALPLDKTGKPGKPFPVVQTNFDEQRGQFSPGGNWIAYQSDESGRHEIYLRAFPGPGNKWPVSTNGGAQVRWRRDEKELFYVALDGRLMAVPVRLTSNGTPPEVGTPVALFAPPLGGTVQQADFRHQYMVSSDGQRFLVATVAEGVNSPITIILNWKPPKEE
jgi:eukaryotic-like serine/threonine-protein kinase